jgi:hypothetical protein
MPSSLAVEINSFMGSIIFDVDWNNDGLATPFFPSEGDHGDHAQGRSQEHEAKFLFVFPLQ